RSIFELAGSGTFELCEKTARILRANRKFCEYTGYDEREVLDLKLFDLIPPGEVAEREAMFARVTSGELERYSGEKCFIRKDGSQFWAIVTGSRMLDLGETSSRVIATLQDITELKFAERELAEAKLRAEEASRAKTAFLANMSHEIRTPLGAMLGFAQLMADEPQATLEQHGHLRTILRNGDQLNRVINDILDISKVEANKIDIEKVRFELNELIGDVIGLLSLKADEKGLQLQVHAVGPLPTTIDTDPVRFKQILLNIIGNAIKFTAKGKIEVAFSLRSNGGRTRLEVRISDTGVGIAPDKVDKLFQPFTQADSATTRNFGGTGLGLYLSKLLAHALGGDLALESTREGAGSVFTISIDPGVVETREIFRSGRPADQIVRPDFRKPSADMLEGISVLVVDDSPDNLQIACRFLQAGGADVDFVDCAEKALERLESKSFDVVLMDIQMPGLDGYQAVGKLRSEMAYTKPVLALTAHAMRGERERCLAAGFDGYLVKPIDRTALLSAVREHATRTTSQRISAETSADTSALEI
ncbi:MAG: response regulator, partial [Bdellovibrionota bacterium]